MRDHQGGTGKLLQEFFEPANRQYVEMVGRLIEQQDIRGTSEHLGEQDAQLEATGEGRKRLPVNLGRQAEPLEDFRGTSLGRIAVVTLHDLLELGVAVRIKFILGALEQRFFGDHRVPQLLVAHHGDAEDLLFLVDELILPQHAELESLGDRHRAAAGFLLAGENGEQRRLARAIGTHQPIALAGGEPKRNVGEQGLAAEGFGEARYGDHGGRWVREKERGGSAEPRRSRPVILAGCPQHPAHRQIAVMIPT